MLRLLTVLLLTNTLFGQVTTPIGSEVTVEEREFSEAKEVEVEPIQDKVLLFTKELKTGKVGLYIQVQSKAKHVLVRASTEAGKRQVVSKLSKPNLWIMEGTKGRYIVEVIEFDPELGIGFTDIPATIGKEPDPLPPGNYEELGKLAKVTAIALNDKVTANKLGKAYEDAVLQMRGKTLEECSAIATVARFKVLNMREGPSLKVDWNSWLNTVDKEFVKVVGNDPVRYAEALATIAEALQEV